jgi:tetratricopeptide (TPR) repeat protein
MGEKHIIPEPPRWLRSIVYILDDEAPGALGLALWQYARHFRDWIESGAEQRAALFHKKLTAHVVDRIRTAKQEAPELAEALDRFGVVVAGGSLRDEEISASCAQVSEWAESVGYQRTAIEFAELAALLDADSARGANRAGRVNRNVSDFARAEVWFERAIGLARRNGDHVEYTRSHIGYGILCQTIGKDRRARQHFHTAAVIARKDGRRWLAAEAQHDLMLMSTERGHYAEAEGHAAKAFAWYPKHHNRFPFFVADLCFLLVCEAQYSVAVKLLTAFLSTIETPAQQVLGMSTLVRALAGAGERTRFARTRAQALRLLNEYREHEPAARINIAEGERAVGLWRDAEENARKALELASARRDLAPERLARELLVNIERRIPPPAESNADGAEHFTTMLISAATRLAEWTPTRRGRVPTVGRTEWAAA